MKYLFTVLALTISFSMNAQISTNNTGASGTYASAIGDATIATGNTSTAMGYGSEATADKSTAMGYFAKANGNFSTAMGRDSKANGVSSATIGFNTTASDYGSLVIGVYNSAGSSVTSSATAFNTANTAFVIGNGTASNAKSDAFKVMFNGDATVGNDLTVSGDIVINSDMRLKANIISLGSTLYKLLQIDGKTYTMKRDAKQKQKIGVLAQDIEKVFPELVVENNNGIKSVNYQGLVPVLINSIKEQDAKINQQQVEIEKLKEQDAKISRLEALVERLISNK